MDEMGFQFNDGAATANVVAAYSPVSYSWSTGATTTNINNLIPGSYWLEVTDALGCSQSQTFDIAAYDCSGLTLSLSHSDEMGFQFNDGTATALASNGQAAYSYQWNNGATSSTVSNLTPGMYSVTLTDQAACQVMDSVEILAYDCSILSISTSKTDQSVFGLNNGTATVNILSGVAPYTFLWNTGASSQSINNLAPGNYAVIVISADDCLKTASVYINAIDCNGVLANYTVNDESCFGESDGSIVPNVIGGQSPYTYNWNTGATSSILGGQAAGTYYLTITDNVGCSITDTLTINGQSSALTATVQITDVSTINGMDGAIDLTVIGGTAPYTYFWSTGATSEDISNLSVGTYWVIVNDAFNCSFTGTYTVGNAAACTPPINISVAPSNNGVAVFWDAPLDGADNYTIEYRAVGTLNWLSSLTSNTIFLNNSLTLCTDYEYRLNSICNYVASSFTAIDTFSTTGCGLVCPNTLVDLNSANLVGGSYQVADYIESNGILSLGITLSYQAENYVNLQSGFEVKIGGDFEAKIEDCY